MRSLEFARPLQCGSVPVLHTPKVRKLSSRRAVLACCIIATCLLAAIAIVGACLFDMASETDFTQKSLLPCEGHPFGTDWMGRDVLARTLAGLSLSIGIGMVAAVASSIIALGFAFVSAFFGGKVDSAVNWLVDLFMGIPHIVLLILISYAIGKGFMGVTVALAFTHWPNLTRVLRAEILQCRQSQYVKHATSLGATPFQILRNHLLLYIIPQYITGLVLLFPHAILHEASITFLGFGLPPEIPSIGMILSESMQYLSSGMWWIAIFPGIALVMVVMLFDAVGSNLRRMIDPHTSQE